MRGKMSWRTLLVLVVALGCGLWAADTVASDHRADAQATPIVTVRFSQNPVDTGAAFTLFIDVDNLGNATGSQLSFTTSDIAGVTPTSIGSTCGGGVNRAWSGDHISVVNDFVQGNVKCTYFAGLSIGQPGTQAVTVDDLVTTFGTSAAASADITVEGAPVVVAPAVSVEFDPATVQVGQPTNLIVTIDNSANTIDGTYSLASTALTDLIFDNTGTVTTDCAAGPFPWNWQLQVSNQTLTAGEVCTIEVSMGFDAVGSQSITVDLTSSDYGNTSVAPVGITITESPVPVVSMSFDPSVVAPGGSTNLTVSIDNQAYVAALMTFSTTVLNDLASASTQTDCGGGGQSWIDGVFSTTNRTAPARTVCTFVFDLVFDESSHQTVSITDMVTTLGDPQDAAASIQIQPLVPPVISVDFTPSPVAAGQFTTAVITVDNSGSALDATSFSFATKPISGALIDYVDSTCGGGGYATGNGQFSTSLRNVSGGQSCTFTLRYVFPSDGIYKLVVEDFVSILGSSQVAAATITVTALEPPQVSLAFDPSPATVGKTTRLTITIDNSHNALDATTLKLATSAVEGAILEYVGQTCLGSGGHASANGSMKLSDRTVAGETTCTITVDYVFVQSGDVTVEVNETMSTFGTSDDAETTVHVDPAVPPVVSASFAAPTVEVGTPVLFSIVVDNAGNELAATDLALETAAIAGADVSFGDDKCGGGGHTITNGSYATSYRFIAAGDECLIALEYTFATPGNYTATVQGVVSSLGASASASGSIIVTSPILCNGLAITIDMSTNGGIGTGTAGVDVILGTAAADAIDGLGGDDTICAGDGDDMVQGGPGNDTIFGEGGNDKLFGAQGHDVIDGGDGDDTIHGNRGNDTLSGGNGADKIFGYAHDDTIDGGRGDDRLHGNYGDDVINGGDGDDRIFGYGDADELHGGAGNDLMSGNFGNDVLDGDGGDDVLFGADGDDTVNGGAGNDKVNGNSLNDILNGGSGDDALDGGIDVDVCHGNSGIDTATRCESTTGIP